MQIADQLFEGQLVSLGAIDHENDPAIEAKWTEDPEYLSMISLKPVRPLAAAQVKKQYEAIEKQSEEGNSLYYFTIRLKPSEDEQIGRLVGFARLDWITWTGGNAHITLGIGDQADRRKGYGSDALQMLLHYAFSELNLFRVSANIPEYNQAALALFRKFGFIEEVRRRGAVNRGGQRWDLISLGLLQSEWSHPQ